jgi:apolipoprotein N-acyltransferase
LALPAVVFGGAVLVSRAAARRLAPGLAIFAFPAAWVSYEFLSSLVSPHGTASSLAYTQAEVLPVVQVASVTGIWGITFLVTLVPAALAVAWSRRTYRALVPAAVILAAALGFGFIRLSRPAPRETVRVGLAAADRDIAAAFRTRDRARALEVAREYSARVERLAAGGARVVVLPEKFLGMTPEDSAAVVETLAGQARKSGVTLVAGLNRVAVAPLRNVAAVIDPGGRVLAEYEKRHLLPGPETGYGTGAAPGFFSAPGATWGVAICKDMDFPEWSREYGRSGVTALAVTAWDFVSDGRLHSRMAILRGVVNGFAMARAAQEGLLTVTDGYGRVLAERSTSAAPEVLLTADLPPGPGPTLYTRYGDWFGWLNVAALVALLAAVRLSRQRLKNRIQPRIHTGEHR